MPTIKRQNAAESAPFAFDFEAVCARNSEGSFVWLSPSDEGYPRELRFICSLIEADGGWYIFKDNNNKESVRVLINGREVLCLSHLPFQLTQIVIRTDSEQHVFFLSFEEQYRMKSRGFQCGYCRGQLEIGETAVLEKGIEYHEGCYHEFSAL